MTVAPFLLFRFLFAQKENEKMINYEKYNSKLQLLLKAEEEHLKL